MNSLSCDARWRIGVIETGLSGQPPSKISRPRVPGAWLSREIEEGSLPRYTAAAVQRFGIRSSADYSLDSINNHLRFPELIAVNQRVDFSVNAKVYDRRHGAVLAEDLVQRLAAAGAMRSGTSVLDIGAGTGRVAIGLAELACNVVALEPALGMVETLRTKADGLPIRIIAGEGAQLPFSAGQFDVVVIARVLYLTADWRGVLREAHRVLAVGGRLLHEWGNGRADEEWVQIREKARALFEEAGISSPFHPGVRSEREVDDNLNALGFVRSSDLPIGPGPTLTLAEFLRRLIDGEFSYIWNVPKAVQEQCLPRLKAWSEQRFDLERSISMPRELSWTVYCKDAV
jgi:SAM-dependent methyltransferase